MTDSHDSERPSPAMDAKLETIAKAAPEKPAWYEAWSRLGSEPSEEERLSVYRAIRDSGLLPEVAGFFLVSMQVDEIAARDADGDLGEHEDEAIKEVYRFDDGTVWTPENAPERYEERRREYHDAWDELFARKLKKCDEPEMARLFRTGRQRFEQLLDRRKKFFHGDEEIEDTAPMLWLQGLVEAVAENMTANSAMGPLGHRYGQDGDFWEVSVYAIWALSASRVPATQSAGKKNGREAKHKCLQDQWPRTSRPADIVPADSSPADDRPQLSQTPPRISPRATQPPFHCEVEGKRCSVPLGPSRGERPRSVRILRFSAVFSRLPRPRR